MRLTCIYITFHSSVRPHIPRATFIFWSQESFANKELYKVYQLTILSLRGICESCLRSSTVSSNSPLMKRSNLTLAPLALIRRKICLRKDANVSLLCVKISTSSTARPGFENRTSSARCFPLHALELKYIYKRFIIRHQSQVKCTMVICNDETSNSLLKSISYATYLTKA